MLVQKCNVLFQKVCMEAKIRERYIVSLRPVGELVSSLDTFLSTDPADMMLLGKVDL